MKLAMRVGAAVAGVSLITGAAFAGDCTPQWDLSIGQPGVDGTVHALAVWDDGNGPALYVGGNFATAGGATVNGVAKWDGEQWSDLEGGLAGGGWAGEQGPFVREFAVYDDGRGEALYVGGSFETAAGTVVNNIARWDGESWSDVGGGVEEGFTYIGVEAMAVRDGLLYVGGNFELAGGKDAQRLAVWDGESWSTISDSISNFVFNIIFYDDGTGEDLYLVGAFFNVNGLDDTRFIARYDGENWHSVDGGLSGGQAHSAAVFDDRLYVGGFFNTAGDIDVSRIASWDGSAWDDVNGGVSNGFGVDVRALTVFNDGDGERLYAGGSFGTAGSVSGLSGLAAWDGDAWSAPIPEGTNALVRAFTTMQGQQGLDLVIGGEFTSAGGGSASRIALWQGCFSPDPDIPGDLTGDGTVGVPDLLILINSWGDCADCDDCPADLTDNCTVGVPDLLILINNWG